ncbi:MAG: hypothetical protein IJ523_05360 [Succinivibrionaceae bacterium]|nr:hypothetical protein [Succinivibrionaceae bacterium]
MLRPKKISSTNITATADRTSLVNIEKISWDLPAAKSGLRAGDIIIAFEGDDWSVFDIAESNPDRTQQKFNYKLDTKSSQPITYIVYRPAQGEFGEPKGQFLRVGPLPVGKKGFRYVSSYQTVTYNQNNSSSYARSIRELYKTAKIQQAPVSVPDASGYKKDTRVFPGAHQEFSEILSTRGPVTGWFWYDDKSGRFLSEPELRQLVNPTVSIRSYPNASIYISAAANCGGGDPMQNRDFALLANTNDSGVMKYSGADSYKLPVNATCLAFRKSGMKFMFEDPTMGQDELPLEQQPFMSKLSKEDQTAILNMAKGMTPAMQAALVLKVKEKIWISEHPGEDNYEVTEYGYFPIDGKQTVYRLVKQVSK